MKKQKNAQKKVSQVVVLGQASKLTLGLVGAPAEGITRHYL